MGDDPKTTLDALLGELARQEREREAYERDDMLEGVIECNREMSETRAKIREHCAASGLGIPEGV